MTEVRERSVIRLELPGGTVAFSTRCGGVSEGPYRSLNLGILTDDDPERVGENRRRLAGDCGLDPGRVAMGWQVHGTDVKEWAAAPGRGGFASPGSPLARVDGHSTTVPGLGLLILAADCLPVALVSRRRVAMLHCGWRGLAGGILERALALFDDTPVGAIGPGIGPCCYEVGPEVVAAFDGPGGGGAGRMLDLRAIAREKLLASGVQRIDEVALCTSCREDLFFSHRRDAGVTGRQGGLAWRTT